MPKRKTKKEEVMGAGEETGEEIRDEAAGSTEGLRAVPRENASKNKLNKTFLLGACLVLLVGAVVFLSKKQTPSQVFIKTQKDKFRVDFVIKETDKNNASKLSEKLEVPQTVLQGMEFKLDSTSSAKLAFANPISLDLTFATDSVSFQGSSHIPLIDATLPSPSGFKIPATTRLALFGKDFLPVIYNNFNFQQELKDWIAQNISGETGQYLIIFGDNNDFSLSVKKGSKTDFSPLEKIKLNEGEEPVYKQETDGNISIHLVRLPEEEQKTFAFFELGDWLFMTSSFDSAKNMLGVQKGEAPLVNFPKTKDRVSFAAFSKKSGSPANSLALFTENDRFQKYLNNIKQSLVVLSGETIEGYIDF